MKVERKSITQLDGTVDFDPSWCQVKPVAAQNEAPLGKLRLPETLKRFPISFPWMIHHFPWQRNDRFGMIWDVIPFVSCFLFLSYEIWSQIWYFLQIWLIRNDFWNHCGHLRCVFGMHVFTGLFWLEAEFRTRFKTGVPRYTASIGAMWGFSPHLIGMLLAPPVAFGDIFCFFCWVKKDSSKCLSLGLIPLKTLLKHLIGMNFVLILYDCL